ncbi:MAG: glycosyltransferase family 2 protein [Kiritimatiellae bacterium]|nr:glycosyltransferase family 2 protein [Kiritimatiellia bacterium]MDD5521902.1 glycosyltransferase family 2 protein [Kiritimatiellia bacterium]
MSVSVVICTKNEGEGIRRIIESVKPYAGEVIVIDGHSTDNTADIVRSAGVSVWLDNGKGKGDAYKVGIEKTTGDVIVFIDADGSHEPADIPCLVAPIEKNEADLVVASRHRGGSDEWGGDFDTYIRAVGGGILTLIVNYRWNIRLTDILNGFRAVRRDVAVKVPLRAVDFDVEQHMIVQYVKHGYRVKEIRSHEYCRKWGKSKLPTYRKAYLFFWRLFLDLVGW